MPNNESQEVYIIILNWNGKIDTLDCLESLKRSSYHNQNIIVVDNGSSDNSTEQIALLHPYVTLIKTGKNLGYAEGNNVGIRHALKNNADFIFIINNDTLISETCITELVDNAVKLPNAAILSPLVLYQNNPNTICYAGTLVENRTFRFSRDCDGLASYKLERKSPYKTITGAGCALFIRANILKKIGLFHKDYFLYWEEMDLSYRVKKSEYDIYVVPTAKIWHKVGSSFDQHQEQASIVKNYYWHRNRLLWAKRNLKTLDKCRVYYLTLMHLLPKLYVSKVDKIPFYKLLYWSINETINNYKKRLKDPIYRASLLGSFHFIIHRFGEYNNKK